MKQRQLVLVEWVDSHSTKGWQPLDDLADGAEPLHCRSVGWLVSKSKETIVIVAHISGEANENLRLFGNGDMAIPTSAVTRIKRLRA